MLLHIISSLELPRLRAILQQSLDTRGEPVQLQFESSNHSKWKFAIRMHPRCGATDLDDQMDGRRVLVCGCPLGGQYLYTPATNMECFIIIYCVGHVPAKHYGFCNETYEPKAANTWECASDQFALDNFFAILHNLRQCVFYHIPHQRHIAFVGQSAGCQVLLAIAAATNPERL